MKKIKSKRLPLVFAIVFAVAAPICLNILSLIVATYGFPTLDAGLAIGDVLFEIANWPTIQLRIYPTAKDADGVVLTYDAGTGFFHPLINIVNFLGWAIPGFIIGLIISAVMGRRGRE